MKLRIVEFPPNGMGAHIHCRHGVSRFGEGAIFLEAPDETLVKNVSPSFWKYQNGSILPMSEEEQHEINARHKNGNFFAETDDSEFDARVEELILNNNDRIFEKAARDFDLQDTKTNAILGGLSNRIELLGFEIERVSLRMKKLEMIVISGFIVGFLTALGIIAEVFFGF